MLLSSSIVRWLKTPLSRRGCFPGDTQKRVLLIPAYFHCRFALLRLIVGPGVQFVFLRVVKRWGFVVLFRFLVREIVLVNSYLGHSCIVCTSPQKCQGDCGRGCVVVESFSCEVIFIGFGIRGCCQSSTVFCFCGDVVWRRGFISLNPAMKKVWGFVDWWVYWIFCILQWVFGGFQSGSTWVDDFLRLLQSNNWVLYDLGCYRRNILVRLDPCPFSVVLQV